jgi:hypothetical protein
MAVVSILLETEKVQVSVIRPCLIAIAFPSVVTVRGIDAYYRNLLEVLRLQPGASRLIVDMTAVQKVQLGAPIEASKWLPKTKKFSSRVAIYGLKPWLRGMLRSVLTISMRDDIKIFLTLADAQQWITNTPSNFRN